MFQLTARHKYLGADQNPFRQLVEALNALRRGPSCFSDHEFDVLAVLAIDDQYREYAIVRAVPTTPSFPTNVPVEDCMVYNQLLLGNYMHKCFMRYTQVVHALFVQSLKQTWAKQKSIY